MVWNVLGRIWEGFGKLTPAESLVAFLRNCEYTDQLLTGSGWLHISWAPFTPPRHFVRLGYYK